MLHLHVRFAFSQLVQRRPEALGPQALIMPALNNTRNWQVLWLNCTINALPMRFGAKYALMALRLAFVFDWQKPKTGKAVKAFYSFSLSHIRLYKMQPYTYIF